MTRKGRPPPSLSDHRDEKPDGDWYDDYSHDKLMSTRTIKLGFWATKNEMRQLWKSIESEMDMRQVLYRDTSTPNIRGALAVLQTERLDAVEAGIETIKHFKNMMDVINCHENYKYWMTRALRHHCLQRCYFQRIKPETLAPAARRGRRRARATSKPVPTTRPRKVTPSNSPAIEKECPEVALGFQTISIGLNGIENMVNYLILHLVPDENGLKKLSLPSDEMKARLQPEDLSFNLLVDLVVQDCQIQGHISVTCPELEWDVINERTFQSAIYSLLKIGSELKFMFSNPEFVSRIVL